MIGPVDNSPEAASQVRRTDRIIRPAPSSPGSAKDADDSSFADVLQEELETDITVSAHARRRMQNENIKIDENQNARLNEAVSRVKRKGGKTSLVMLDDMAMIVNVRQQKLVTIVADQRQTDGVFTNIDSAVIAE